MSKFVFTMSALKRPPEHRLSRALAAPPRPCDRASLRRPRRKNGRPRRTRRAWGSKGALPGEGLHLCCIVYKTNVVLAIPESGTTGSTFTSEFSCRTFRNVTTTPAIRVSIRMSPALQKTLRCTHYSVAKRQQTYALYGERPRG